MFDGVIVSELVATVVYSVLGMGLFVAGYFLVEWLSPFSLRKELEEDQNVAVGVLLGALAIAVAIIISAVIR